MENIEMSAGILEFVGEVTVPRVLGSFIAKKEFVHNITPDAPLRISYIGCNFAEWFLVGDQAIDVLVNEQILRYVKLRRGSMSGPIVIELGGETKAEIALVEMFSLMKLQKSGGNGRLLDDRDFNIFHIRDESAILRAVGVRWFLDGWLIDAFPIENPHVWRAACRVFYRRSSK